MMSLKPYLLAALLFNLIATSALPARADEASCKLVAAAEVKLDAAAQKRMNGVRTRYDKIGPGEIITLQVIAPAKANQPTLLLLPGIFRALTALSVQEEPRARELVQKGFGVALLTLSTQPYSLMELPAGEKPASKDTLADYRNEVSQAVKILTEEERVKNIVPVSLSFSSSISAGLTDFPLIIDTVPLTSTEADKPKLGQALRGIDMMNAMNTFNPFYDRNFARKILEDGYRTEWVKYVTDDPTGHIRNHQPTTEQKQNFVEGYIAMTRAIESFKWPKAQDMAQDSRRVFILARNESKDLLKHQLATFQDISHNRAGSVLFMIEESGHVLPKDQPAAYAQALAMATSQDLAQFSGVVVITPSTGQLTRLTGADAEAYVKNMMVSL